MALASSLSSGAAAPLFLAAVTHSGISAWHRLPYEVRTIGAKTTGIAAEAATALAIGYEFRSLQIALNVVSLKTNGVRL